LRWNYTKTVLILAAGIIAARLAIGAVTGDPKQFPIGLNVLVFALVVGFIADLVSGPREARPPRREGPQPPPSSE